MSMRAQLPAPGPLVDDREMTHEEVAAQSERLAVRLQKPSFQEVLTALDAGELSGRPEELRARMLRHLLGK